MSSSFFLQRTKTISGSVSCHIPDSCGMIVFGIRYCLSVFPSVPIPQAPLDFVLRGCLEHEVGVNEEIGLDLIPGYALKVFRLQCLCLYLAISISDPIGWIVFGHVLVE